MEDEVCQQFLKQIADYDKEELLELIEQFLRESAFKTCLINNLVRAYLEKV